MSARYAKSLSLLIASVIVQSVCTPEEASAQPHPPGDGNAPRPVEVVDKEIQDRLAQVSKFLPALADTPRGLAEPTLKSASPWIWRSCATATTYDKSAIELNLQLRKSFIIRALSTVPEASALRAYIEDEFPTTLAASQDQCFDRPVVVEKEVFRLERATRNFVSAQREPSYALRHVVITSSPEGATFTWTAKGGGATETTQTNTRVRHFWRGRYRYEVSKNGYASGSGELTIINGQEATIRCTLERDVQMTNRRPAAARCKVED